MESLEERKLPQSLLVGLRNFPPVQMDQTILKLVMKVIKVAELLDETQTTLGNNFGEISEGNRTTFPLALPLIAILSLGQS